MSPESHAVPVDLITVAQQTNVARRGAAAADKISRCQAADAASSRRLPQFADVEPAPEPPMPQIKIIQPKTEIDQPDQPKTKQSRSARISPPCSTSWPAQAAAPQECQAWPAHRPGHRRSQCDDRRSGRRAEKPDRPMLEPAGGRAQCQRSGGGFRSCAQSATARSRAATLSGNSAAAIGQSLYPRGGGSGPPGDLSMRAV